MGHRGDLAGDQAARQPAKGLGLDPLVINSLGVLLLMNDCQTTGGTQQGDGELSQRMGGFHG